MSFPFIFANVDSGPANDKLLLPSEVFILYLSSDAGVGFQQVGWLRASDRSCEGERVVKRT